jgi:two-component system phosphate regulon response regulator OmpR
MGAMDDTEPHLLIVDDDVRLRELLRRYLSDNGFRVTAAADAAEARARLASFAFDLMVLDVMMPGESGLDLTLALRGAPAERRVPILLLTAMGEPEDRVNGLEHGADDYLAKPFEPRELVLRIRNILQRRPATDGAVRFGSFHFNPDRGELLRGGESVHLTAAEAGLLTALAQRAGDPVSREELSQSAPFSGNIRNVDVQMTRLRRKIERDPRYPRYLQTVRGTGYVLKPE